MKILVTGTISFIGHALVKKLLERGDEVVGNVDLNYVRIDIKAGVRYSLENNFTYVV